MICREVVEKKLFLKVGKGRLKCCAAKLVH